MNYLTTEQAAAQLGVQPQTVVKHIMRGNLAATKIGRDYLIEPHELTRFQQARRGIGYPKGRPRKPSQAPS